MLFKSYILNFRMSYQKKSVILQQLEQAIRKKAQEKSKNKQQVGRVLQSSIEKKKTISRATGNRDHRVGSNYKNQNVQKPNKAEKYITLFNNEGLNTVDSQDFKLKKYNNRKFDKLVSLITYMVSSSEKAIKYISSNNFEAEFALKLYRSDKQNLVNEIRNFNIQDLLDSNRGQDANRMDPSYHTLMDQNNKLKKDLLVFEKEAERFHRGSGQDHQHIFKAFQKENHKLKEIVRKITPFQNFKQLMDLLEKEGKFEAMSLKCQQNSRKITQIQIVITSLQSERNEIVQNMLKGKVDQRSDRTSKMMQIQSEKDQLHKEIGILKSKISQLKESSKLISQHELLRKNNELIHEKLQSLAHSISNQNLSPSKKHSEALVQFIKIKVEDLIDSNEELERQNGKLTTRLDKLQTKHEQILSINAEKEDEAASWQSRMESILDELEKMKQMADILSNQRDQLVDKLSDSDRLLKNKEEQLDILTSKLNSIELKEQQKQELRVKNSQIRKEIQTITKRFQQKDKQWKQKYQRLQLDKMNLEEKLQIANKDIEIQTGEMNDIVKTNQQRNDEIELKIQQLKIKQGHDIEEWVQKYEALEGDLNSQKLKYQKLVKTYEQSNEYYKSLTDSYQQKHQRVNELQGLISQMQLRIEEFEEKQEKAKNFRQSDIKLKTDEKEEELIRIRQECDRVNKDYEDLNKELRSIQQQKVKYGQVQEEIITLRDQNNQLLTQNNKLQNQLNNCLQKKKYISIELKNYELIISQQKIEVKQLKQKNELIRDEKSSLENIFEQRGKKHSEQLKESNKKLHESQLLNISLKRQKIESQELFLMQKDKCQSLNQKLKILECELGQLKQQMKSLSVSQNEKVHQKEESRVLMTSLEEQKEVLHNELYSAKQHLEDQSQLNRFKMKQYVNLLKQILKGLSLESEAFENIDSFEQLLQFGSKHVLEMRKKLREQESNKRKNRQEGYSSRDNSSNSSPNLEDIKVKLFSTQDEFKKEEKIKSFEFQQKQQKQQMPSGIQVQTCQIDEFDQMKLDGNESITSEDNRRGLEEFDDLNSEKMNQSMVSNKEIQGIKQSPLKEQQIQGNNLSEFPNISDSHVNSSIVSVQNDNKFSQKINKEIKENSQDSFKMSYKPQIIEDVGQIQQYQGQLSDYMQENKTYFNQSSIKQNQQFNFSGPKMNEGSEIQFNSSNQEVKKTNLEDFMDMNSQNQSIVSTKEKEEQKQVSQQDSNSSEVVIYPIKKIKSLEGQPQMLKPSQSGAGFDEFGDVDDIKVDSSMISQNGPNLSQFKEMRQGGQQSDIMSKDQSGQKVDIDQFGQIKNEEVNKSLLSEKQDHQMSDFGSVKQNSNNDSVLSRKDEHEMSQFGDMPQNPNNDSVLSKKSEHGMSEFGDVPEDEHNNSVLSKKQESDHDLAEFKGVSENVNDSVMSKMSQHGLSDFGELQDNPNDSIISKRSQHGLSEFKENVQNSNNDSYLSKKSQHGISEFGDFTENVQNDSVISRKSEHGLSDFGDPEPEVMNESIISQKDPLQNKEQMKGSNLDDFEQFKGEKMNDSIISETDSKN